MIAPMHLESLIGSVFAGRFRIDALLGTGGMGAVYLAHHEVLDRFFALKILYGSRGASAGDEQGKSRRPHAGAAGGREDDQGAADRFRREARAAARIEHPNIVQILDFGHSPEGVPYLAMERVEGTSLADVLTAQGPLPLPRAVDVLLQVATALGAAHSRQVIHRDLKPQNVMLTRREGGRDLVKILDFGLAQILDHTEGSGLVGPSAGTPGYVAPEQIAERPYDHRTDLYSFGAMAFEVVTGRLPFPGQAMQMLEAHLHQPPPVPSQVAGRPLPAALDALILRCLAKDPVDRFHDAGELVAVLEVARAEVQLSSHDAHELTPEAEAAALLAGPATSALRDLVYAIRDRHLGTPRISEQLARLLIAEDRLDDARQMLLQMHRELERLDLEGRSREARFFTLLRQLLDEKLELQLASDDELHQTVPFERGGTAEDIWTSGQRLEDSARAVEHWLQQIVRQRRVRMDDLAQRIARHQRAMVDLEREGDELREGLRELLRELWVGLEAEAEADPYLLRLAHEAGI